MGAGLLGGVCVFWCCFREVFFISFYIRSLCFFCWQWFCGGGWRGGGIGRFSFAVGQGGGCFLRGSDCLALGSVVAGEMAAGVGLAAAGAQEGGRSIAGEGGGVMVSVVIVVGAGGGLGLLFGVDVALDGESF